MNDDNGKKDELEGGDLLGDLEIPETEETPEGEEASEPAEETAAPETEAPTEAEAGEEETPPAEASEDAPDVVPLETQTAEDTAEEVDIERLSKEAATSIIVSTLTTSPPGFTILSQKDLVQTSVLLQSKRIEDLRLQNGMQEVIHKLKEEASHQDCNAILGVQINVVPLGQLYPDSVWITAAGTCCQLKRRESRKRKAEAKIAVSL